MERKIEGGEVMDTERIREMRSLFESGDLPYSSWSFEGGADTPNNLKLFVLAMNALPELLDAAEDNKKLKARLQQAEKVIVLESMFFDDWKALDAALAEQGYLRA
jgi:hypothetical protein